MPRNVISVVVMVNVLAVTVIMEFVFDVAVRDIL